MRFFIFLLLLFLSLFLNGQDRQPFQCNNSKAHNASNQHFLDNYKKSSKENGSLNRLLGGTSKASSASSNSLVCLPLVLHIIRDSNGTDYLDPIDIPRFMSTLNAFMIDMGAKFHVAEIRYMDSDFYSNHNNTPDLNVFDQFDDETATNIYIRSAGGNSGGGIGSNNLHLSQAFRTADYTFNAIVLHEFGHNFGLLHTHAYTSAGNTYQNAENVARTGAQANCDTSGDGFCDTPADNTYSPDDTDIHGIPYQPDETNFMSYRSDQKRFSAEQILAMQAGLVEKLNHPDYDLDGYVQANPPASPTLLSVDFMQSYNELTWTDVDDIGYIVERSEVSATAGFRAFAVGGTPQDVTTYIDTDIAPNKEYWYRVIPVNSCDAYSNILSLSTIGLTVYCAPDYFNNCNEGLSLAPDAVLLSQSGTALFNDNSIFCESYHDVIDYSPVVLLSHQNYTLDFTLSNDNSIYLNFYIDINRDGDFDDADERVIENAFRTYSQDYTAEFSIPTELVNEGVTGMRLIINQAGSSGLAPYSACESPHKNVFVRDYLITLEQSCVPILYDFEKSDEEFSDGNECTIFPAINFHPAENSAFSWKATESHAGYYIVVDEAVYNAQSCDYGDLWMLPNQAYNENPANASAAGGDDFVMLWAQKPMGSAPYHGLTKTLDDLTPGQYYEISFEHSPISTAGVIRQTSNLQYQPLVTFGENQVLDIPVNFQPFSNRVDNRWTSTTVVLKAKSVAEKIRLEFPIIPDPNNEFNDGYVGVDNITITCTDAPVMQGKNTAANFAVSNEPILYPNPTKDLLNIKLPDSNSTITTIQVFNSQGVLVLDRNHPAGTTFDISTLPSGIYIVTIVVDHSKGYSQKLVKIE